MTGPDTGGRRERACLVRHARTAHSVEHRLNGRVDLDLGLDAVGRGQCRAARSVLPVAETTVCVVSGFARAQHTARLLLTGRPVPIVVDDRLNELDYGRFEGGPFWDYGNWLTRHGIDARPPGGTESQRQGLRRMLAGLRAAAARPGRPLVVAHGLLASVVAHTRAGGSPADLVFPEAGYLAAVPLTAADVAEVDRRLAAQRAPAAGAAGGAGVATVAGASCRSESARGP